VYFKIYLNVFDLKTISIKELEREPVHPGEILEEKFLKPLKLSQSQLAKEIAFLTYLYDLFYVFPCLETFYSLILSRIFQLIKIKSNMFSVFF